MVGSGGRLPGASRSRPRQRASARVSRAAPPPCPSRPCPEPPPRPTAVSPFVRVSREPGTGFLWLRVDEACVERHGRPRSAGTSAATMPPWTSGVWCPGRSCRAASASASHRAPPGRRGRRSASRSTCRGRPVCSGCAGSRPRPTGGQAAPEARLTSGAYPAQRRDRGLSPPGWGSRPASRSRITLPPASSCNRPRSASRDRYGRSRGALRDHAGRRPGEARVGSEDHAGKMSPLGFGPQESERGRGHEDPHRQHREHVVQILAAGDGG